VTINEFIKYVQKLYGEDATYKATSKEGVTFKSKGWDEKYDSVRFDEVQLRKLDNKNQSS
jgi:hypothetical protein